MKRLLTTRVVSVLHFGGSDHYTIEETTSTLELNNLLKKKIIYFPPFPLPPSLPPLLLPLFQLG